MNRAFHIGGIVLLLTSFGVLALNLSPVVPLILGAGTMVGLALAGRKKELPLWCYATVTALCVGGASLWMFVEAMPDVEVYTGRPMDFVGLVVEQNRSASSQQLTVLLEEGSAPELVGHMFSLGTGTASDIAPGERIAFTVTPERIDLRRLQGGEALLSGFVYQEPTVVGEDFGHAAVRLETVRRTVADRLYWLLPTEEGGVMGALVTGKQDGISSALRDDFQKAGLSHFLVMSGQHMSILLGTMGSLLQWLVPRRSWRTIAESALTFGLVAMSGFSPSMLRAGFMGILSRTGALLGRQSDGLNSLGLAAVCILLRDPSVSCSLSFLLSYLSTMGILAFHDPFCRLVGKVLPGRDFDGLRERRPALAALVEMAVVTPASLSLTLPLTGWYFGTGTPASLLSNPMAHLPMTGALFFTMTAAVAAFLPGRVFLWMARALAWCGDLCIKGVGVVVGLVGYFPAGVVSISQVVALWEVAVLACLVFLWYNRFGRGMLWCAFGLGLCVLSTVRLASADLWTPPLTVLSPLYDNYIVLLYGQSAAVMGLPKDAEQARLLGEELRLRGASVVSLLVMEKEEDTRSRQAKEALEAALPVERYVCMEEVQGFHAQVLGRLSITGERDSGISMAWGPLRLVKTFDQRRADAHILVNGRGDVIVAPGLPIDFRETGRYAVCALHLPDEGDTP